VYAKTRASCRCFIVRTHPLRSVKDVRFINPIRRGRFIWKYKILFWWKCCWNLVELQKSTFIWYALTVAWWREGSSVCVCERVFWGVCVYVCVSMYVVVCKCVIIFVCVYLSSLCLCVCFFSTCVNADSLCMVVCFLSICVYVCFFSMYVCTCACECGFCIWGSI